MALLAKMVDSIMADLAASTGDSMSDQVDTLKGAPQWVIRIALSQLWPERTKRIFTLYACTGTFRPSALDKIEAL